MKPSSPKGISFRSNCISITVAVLVMFDPGGGNTSHLIAVLATVQVKVILWSGHVTVELVVKSTPDATGTKIHMCSMGSTGYHTGGSNK